MFTGLLHMYRCINTLHSYLTDCYQPHQLYAQQTTLKIIIDIFQDNFSNTFKTFYPKIYHQKRKREGESKKYLRHPYRKKSRKYAQIYINITIQYYNFDDDDDNDDGINFSNKKAKLQCNENAICFDYKSRHYKWEEVQPGTAHRFYNTKRLKENISQNIAITRKRVKQKNEIFKILRKSELNKN